MLLIIDDDVSFLQAAEQALGRTQAVYFARNAEDARALIRSIGANLTAAMVDLDLPGEDGFSLIRQLHVNFPGLPLIAISGVVQRDVLESAKLLGASAALRKPITAEWTTAIEPLLRHAANG